MIMITSRKTQESVKWKRREHGIGNRITKLRIFSLIVILLFLGFCSRITNVVEVSGLFPLYLDIWLGIARKTEDMIVLLNQSAIFKAFCVRYFFLDMCLGFPTFSQNVCIYCSNANRESWFVLLRDGKREGKCAILFIFSEQGNINLDPGTTATDYTLFCAKYYLKRE